jgi:hypothetical protein
MCLGHGLKNLSAFVKTEETDLDRFHQFSINRPVNLKIFEIKNSKKTRADFKIFGQNIIQKYPRARSPAPLRRHWILPFSTGAPPAWFTGKGSDKPVLPAGLPIIAGGIRRQEVGKQLKHGPFAYFFV